jgi:two-component system sensor histidine kinase TctE
VNPLLRPLDPRRSVAAAVGWCVVLPLSALWLWHAGFGAVGASGVCAIAATGVAAGAVAARAWLRLHAALTSRRADDLRPLALQGPLHARMVLQSLNQTLAHQRDVTDRHRRMVADAAHQLRTPLAALRTLIQSTPQGSIAQRVPELLRAVDRATDVANEFLTQMKLEQRLSTAREWPSLQLDDVAREAALEFSPLIAEKRLAFELDAVPVAVQADAWMLGELVRNLLANAIGQTAPRSPLGMVVRQALGAPELVVWDSGGGIAEEVRERIFEPFAAATRGTGVGLGLSICRQLAQAMGAEVALFNRSDGERVVGVDAVVRWQGASAQ